MSSFRRCMSVAWVESIFWL